jgi:hypothetical protein
MTTVTEFQRLTAVLIFDLEDSYSRDRGVNGPHPRPIGSLNYFITGRVTGGVPQLFDAPLALKTVRNPTGYSVFFGDVLSRRGDILRANLPDATYILRIESQYYQPAERNDIVLPSVFASGAPGPGTLAPWFFDLSPGYDYPFPDSSTLSRGRGPTLLRGTLFAPDGTGIQGATIQVLGQSNVCLTDASGQWVLVFPDTQPAGNVTVHFALPDGTTRDVAAQIVIGTENSLSQTELRGFVAKSTGGGLAKAKIQIAGQPGQAISASDGSWFYFFDLSQTAAMVNVTATSSDGRQLTQTKIPVQPRAAVVVPTFKF